MEPVSEYEGLSYDELKAIATDRNIKFAHNASKTHIVGLLRESDGFSKADDEPDDYADEPDDYAGEDEDEPVPAPELAPAPKSGVAGQYVCLLNIKKGGKIYSK